ncbi:molybdenum ABC transporter ATP-binding protein [Rhodovibrio salinarum]|uniref:Molybdenum ABC transporter ATP-binding protein n=1 Tax=Rhodovibrio salinarum TaxID=1087 RepID=A0A934V127_9PROT|nr:molybdenum ABC transporter ATP-binding protein [Rhodovibrio salinarum]MBK1698982.1 molybdenum ABC transporter ATP-binding protein [Rhodovibrio salinarum]
MLDIAVAKRFPGFDLDAAFACPDRGVTALYGRSGAGKSSIVHAIAGLLRPARGRIAVSGTTLFDTTRGIDMPAHKRRIGQVFQDARLFPHYSVRGNLLYGRRRAPAGVRSEELDHVVGLLDLEPLLARRPHDLSGGERQRVALGRALLAGPRLLLMDEPLAALDQERKQRILPFIERLRDQAGVPIVYVSHALDEIVRLADSMVVIEAGGVVAAGPVEEVVARPDLRALTGEPDACTLLTARVVAQHAVDALSELAVSGHRLFVPHLPHPPESTVRLRVRASDVALARTPPTDTSFVNVLAGTVTALAEHEGPLVDVRVAIGNAALWARVTRRSIRLLEIQAGQPIFALIKGVALVRRIDDAG